MILFPPPSIADLKQELKIQQKQPGYVRPVDGGEDNELRPVSTTGKEKLDPMIQEKHSNDSDVEKAELEKTTQERRSSLKLDSAELTNGQQQVNGDGSNRISNGSGPPATTGSAVTRTAPMQRENSLKRKLILAFSSTKSALRPACIFGPRRKRSI